MIVIHGDSLFLADFHFDSRKIKNKKVLLRERKRHTARHVASTRCVVPVGGYLPWVGGGYLP